ncbi:hypothetical protein B566_EDAN012642 [Ephemera danica]|nr:hypothetical protein B566_EDAN012642 [Ephemera danica]
MARFSTIFGCLLVIAVASFTEKRPSCGKQRVAHLLAPPTSAEVVALWVPADVKCAGLVFFAVNSPHSKTYDFNVVCLRFSPAIRSGAASLIFIVGQTSDFNIGARGGYFICVVDLATLASPPGSKEFSEKCNEQI